MLRPLPFIVALVVLLPGGDRNALAQDFQHGETILPAAQAPADAPARRHAKALWFELSNLRKDIRSLRGEVALDFRRSEGDTSWHEIVMVVKNSNGRREYRSIGPSPFAAEQGTVHGKTWFGALTGDSNDPIEVWLEQHLSLGLKPIRMKVSKSITLGNVGQLTFARQWTAEEEQAFANWEKSTTPPPAPPTGYQVVAPDTKLLAGMPVLAGWMAAWKPAEVIDVRQDGTVTVKYSDATKMLVPRQRSWVAVEGKTLDAAAANPSQFKPSVRVAANGITPIPNDLRPLGADVPLIKGTPLRAEWGGNWSDVTVVAARKDGTVRIHWNDRVGPWDEDRDRTTLLIEPETLADLKKPDAAEIFANRAEKFSNSSFESTSRAHQQHLRNYPISIPIPKFATRVDDDTPLEEGTKLGCSWGSQWYDVTVLDVNDDDTVRIRWDKFGKAWDGDVARSCLVINKKILAKLTAGSKTTVSVTPAAPESASSADRFKVVLKSVGAKKVSVVKAVMEATGLDLKDAKEFVEELPVVIKQNLSKSQAEKLRKDLQTAGGTVAIELQ